MRGRSDLLIRWQSINIGFSLVLIFIFFLSFQITGLARSADFTVEQVLGSPFPSSLHTSARGNRIVWVFNIRGIHNIWIAEGPGFQARRLTGFDQDDGMVLVIQGFVDQDRAVVFSKSGRYNPDHRTQWDGQSILYKVNCRTGETEELAKAEQVAVSSETGQMAFVREGELYTFFPGEEPKKRLGTRGNLANPEWSPDGKSIVMESRRGEYPHQYSYILVFHLQEDHFKYINPMVYQDIQPHWSPDGKKIVFIRRLTHRHGEIDLLIAREFPVDDPWEIYTAEVENGRTVRVWKSSARDSFDYAEVRWLGNDDLVFISEADGWRHLYSVPASGGKPRLLTPGPFEVEQFHTVPSLERVFFTSNAEDINRRHIWSTDVKGRLERQTRGKGIEWSPKVTADNQHLVFLGSSATLPAQVYIKYLSTGKQIKLAADSLPVDFPDQLLVPQAVTFKSEDGWHIHGQLFKPRGLIKGKYPAIMYFHGGPIRQMLLGFHYSSYYHKAYAMNQYLASQGYVVLAVNYRLGIGYGRDFREVADGGPRGCSEYQDLLAGAKFLRNLDFVDSSRIGLWGGSYGGLMTALGLARNSDLFAAGVDLHGVHDWNQWQAWASGRQNDDHRMVWKSSPLSDIPSWRSPVLLIHGDDDRNVPFSETLWLVDKLSAQGVDYELLVFPDDVHGFRLHRNWVKAFEAAASFFNRKLKDKNQ